MESSETKSEVTFASFVQKAVKNENTRILMSELLLLFETQLKANFECQYEILAEIICRLILNDAEFTANGEAFLK